MANFYLPRLGTGFTTDPRTNLKNYLSTNWGGSVSPAASLINFSTSWLDLSKNNHIIIEKMPTNMSPQVLGANRSSFVDYYRIQVYCKGPSAISNKFNIEQEIQRIIQASPTGIQTVSATTTGIDYALIDSFTEIEPESDAKINAGMAKSLANNAARSFALVRIFYDKYVA